MPDDVEERAEAEQTLNALMEARSVSSASAPLRQMAFFNVSFQDEPQYEEATDPEGNVTEKEKPSEDVFLQDLICGYLDKYGQYYI